MQDATARSYTLQEAAALLGIGVNTLRRRIAAGQVQAEQVQRPQGYVWRVYLDAPHPPINPADHPPDQESGSTLPHPSTQPAAEAMVSLIQTTIAAVLGPLVGQLDEQRRTIERQAERVAELERENGRLSAKHAALEARTAPQPAPASSTPLSAVQRLLTRWWPVLAVLAVLLATAGVWGISGR